MANKKDKDSIVNSQISNQSDSSSYLSGKATEISRGSEQQTVSIPDFPTPNQSDSPGNNYMSARGAEGSRGRGQQAVFTPDPQAVTRNTSLLPELDMKGFSNNLAPEFLSARGTEASRSRGQQAASFSSFKTPNDPSEKPVSLPDFQTPKHSDITNEESPLFSAREMETPRSSVQQSNISNAQQPQQLSSAHVPYPVQEQSSAHLQQPAWPQQPQQQQWLPQQQQLQMGSLPYPSNESQLHPNIQYQPLSGPVDPRLADDIRLRQQQQHQQQLQQQQQHHQQWLQEQQQQYQQWLGQHQQHQQQLQQQQQQHLQWLQQQQPLPPQQSAWPQQLSPIRNPGNQKRQQQQLLPTIEENSPTMYSSQPQQWLQPQQLPSAHNLPYPEHGSMYPQQPSWPQQPQQQQWLPQQQQLQMGSLPYPSKESQLHPNIQYQPLPGSVESRLTADAQQMMQHQQQHPQPLYPPQQQWLPDVNLAPQQQSHPQHAHEDMVQLEKKIMDILEGLVDSKSKRAFRDQMVSGLKKDIKEAKDIDEKGSLQNILNNIDRQYPQLRQVVAPTTRNILNNLAKKYQFKQPVAPTTNNIDEKQRSNNKMLKALKQAKKAVQEIFNQAIPRRRGHALPPLRKQHNLER